MREIYVYYRVAQADVAAAAQQVRTMQAGLRAQHPGLQARLLRRPLVTDLQTWMEVYSIAGGVDHVLQREIEAAASALRPWIQGTRHCEVFEGF